MKKTRRSIIQVLIVLALVVTAFIFPIFSSNVTYADNGESQQPTVLQDLHKDENFNEDDYPVVADDYSLKVIQIAESVDKELFVYVYQPCSPNFDLWATSINISVATGENLNYKNYKLTLVSLSGVFYKYKVEDFVVKTTPERYYDISSIFRKWNEDYDARPQDSQTIDEVSFEVGNLWTAITSGGRVYYSNTSTEVVEIINKKVGLLRFWNGLHLMEDQTDSHYVAFSCDHEIDKLLEADVTYVWTKKITTHSMFGAVQDTTVLDSNTDNVTLYYDTVVSNPGGLFAKKYTWNQIESVDEFKQDKDLSEEAINDLDGMQWVLNFLVTEYQHFNPNVATSNEKYTEVSEVTILRLKFEKDGVVYNLGVVDNKQTGSNEPENEQEKGHTLLEMIKNFWNGLTLTFKILFITGLVLAGIFVIAVVVIILKLIWDFVAKFFKKDSKK